jgi:DNA-binding transcriptional MocR family regulator
VVNIPGRSFWEIVVSPGQHWFPVEPPGSFLRLSFVGAGPEALERGVALLAEEAKL